MEAKHVEIEERRYLRFVQALALGALGALATAAPVALVTVAACDEKEEPPVPDAGPPPVTIDGPLPPPNLPRTA